jgi:hypothetical protein
VTLDLATQLSGAEADQAQNLGMIAADAYELFATAARGARVLERRLRWFERPLARWLAGRLDSEADLERQRALDLLRAANVAYRDGYGHVIDILSLEPRDLMALDLEARARATREPNA